MAVVLVEHGALAKEIVISDTFKDSVHHAFSISRTTTINFKIYKPRWNRFVDMTSLDELHDGATVRISTVEDRSIAR